MFLSLRDALITLQWWSYIWCIGLVFFPLVSRIFPSFVDRGYPFAKLIGIVCISYIVFILGVAHIAPFTQSTVLITAFLSAFFITVFLITFPQKMGISRRQVMLMILEEVLFAGGLLFWAGIRAHQPDIFGLEKYMDFGFVNSILRSTYFPPKDMWYTPLPINYYYFGHLVTAVLTKLTSISPFITFNLMLATLFSFTLSLSFSVSGNLWYIFLRLKKGVLKQNASILSFITVGILGGFLVTFAGNLHTIYTLFTPYANDAPVPFWQLLYSPKTFPNAYWYPNATRFIYHTIHEFPIYSFVVSDLHGHVLDIPLVLTTLALLFSILISPPGKKLKSPAVNTSMIQRISGWAKDNGYWVFLGFLLSLMYMTNAWDGMIYTLASVPVILIKNYPQEKNIFKNIFSFFTLQKLLLLFFCFLIFSLPFSLFFNPGALVGGIGLVCAPQFLLTIGRIGPFVFEPNHCTHSPLWQLLILYGFFLFWCISFLALMWRERKNITPADQFVGILSGVAILLVVIPEFFYLRDIYTTYFRANTMFKLVYQAFIMFSLGTTFMMVRFIHFFKAYSLAWWRRIFLVPYLLLGLVLFSFVGIYSYFAIFSYYNNLSQYKGLNGFTYLTKSYPTDAAGILWIQSHISGQPVILEAQGDSYTDYARVSANTGLPTVLGWPVHEWLWRGTYDIVPPRSTDIQTMYETTSPTLFSQLAKKYHIHYVFVGQLERVKYPRLSETKFQQVGKAVFRDGATTIYQVTSLQ